MGTGSCVMYRLAKVIEDRYGIPFEVYIERGYHKYEYEDEIKEDIKKRS